MILEGLIKHEGDHSSLLNMNPLGLYPFCGASITSYERYPEVPVWGWLQHNTPENQGVLGLASDYSPGWSLTRSLLALLYLCDVLIMPLLALAALVFFSGRLLAVRDGKRILVRLSTLALLLILISLPCVIAISQISHSYVYHVDH